MWPFSKSKRALEQENAELRASLENPGVGIGDASAWEEFFGELVTSESAGEPVNRKTALSVPAIWAAVNVLSSTIASLPLHAYRKTGEDREKLTGRPIYKLLHTAPNQRWTSYKWRKYLMYSALTSGRSLTWIDRPQPGNVRALWPLDPEATSVEWDEQRKRLLYRYKPEQGTEQVYSEENIIDIPWMLDFDGISHVNPLNKLKRAIGLSIALERYGARFFNNGGVPPLQLTGPIRSPGAAQRASSDLSQRIANASKGRSVLAMPEGHELKGIGFNPEESQMMEARRFAVEEIARVYNVPIVFLQDLTHGTHSNTEQQDLHFVKHTINQWVVSIEQELNLKLFGSSSDRFVEFSVDGLLRGDFQTRMTGYSQAIQNSINTPNEVRRKENLPPMEGGNQLMIQQNMSKLEQLGDLTKDGGDNAGSETE